MARQWLATLIRYVPDMDMLLALFDEEFREWANALIVDFAAKV